MIWFQDPFKFLFDESNWFQIIPIASSPIEDQLNAIFMFALYFTLGMLVIKRDIRVIYVFLFICFMTWLFYRHNKTESFLAEELRNKINIVKEPYQDTYCVKPTQDNPFMNVTMKDIREFPNRPKACTITNSAVKADVDKYFNNGLPRQIGDIYHKKASDRQFFTMPNTTIPNNVDEFAAFAYKIPPTRKQLGQNF